MKYPTTPFPREKDQVIMEIILDSNSSTTVRQSLNQCQVRLQYLFLSNMVTADGKFWFRPSPTLTTSLVSTGVPHSTQLGYMAWLLAQLHNNGQQIESSPWKMDTSIAPEMGLVLHHHGGSRQSWGLFCLSLSSFTIQKLHTLGLGIHVHVEGKASKLSCNGLANLGARVRWATCLQIVYQSVLGKWPMTA